MLAARERVDLVSARAQLEIRIDLQAARAPLDMAAWQRLCVTFLDQPAAVALAPVAIADATGDRVDDPLGPCMVERCDRRQAGRRSCERAALAEQPIELGAVKVIAGYAYCVDLLERAQIVQRIRARDDEVGALANRQYAAAVGEEAAYLARCAAQRLVRRHAGGDEIAELGM